MHHSGVLLLNRRSEFTVVTCLKANEKLNVAAEHVRGHLHRAQINTSLVGLLITFHNAALMEVVGSSHQAVSGWKYHFGICSERVECCICGF